MNQAELREILGEPKELTKAKVVDRLNHLTRQFVERAPFVVVATGRPDGGLDVSPRGDPAGFVHVRDERTLLMPERRGNNRADSLRNIVTDPRVGLLFLIPGVGETLRVNGRATISVDPALIERFRMQGQLPKCVLVIDVDTVFFQCARAITRSSLWRPVPADAQRPVPTPGAMLEALTQAAIDGAAYDRDLPERQRASLY